MTRWFLPFVFWRLKVPDSIKNGIMEFINRYHLEPDMFFDCYSFANMVFGIKQNLCSELLNFWELKPKRRFSRTGELVFITIDGKDYKEFRHAAIYLGFGLYISVYGAGGGLEVSTLKNMKKFFGGDKVFFATPLSN